MIQESLAGYYLKKLNFLCSETKNTDTNPIGTITDFVPSFKIENTCEECLPTLEPSPGKAYNISTWMATDSSLLCGVPPIDYGINVIALGEDLDTLVKYTLQPKGPIIEGWQQIEAKIEIPVEAEYFGIQFTRLIGNKPVSYTHLTLPTIHLV